MSSTKEIRNRIKAIKNTAKITKAMQMVAASKMKKAQDATTKNRPYSEETGKVVGSLSADLEIENPLTAKFDKATKKLVVVITSDKGLCGSFNTAVIRKALDYIKDDNADIITVGKKAENFFRRTNRNILASFTDFPVSPRSYDVRPLIKTITDSYKTGEYKEIAFAYTLFESTLKQVPTIQTVLPMDTTSFKGEALGQHGDVPEQVVKFEPSPKEVINFLLPRILETTIYQIFLESIASEQSARMVAMKNATDAASDLVDDLNLTYNSIRQASITQELAEISAATNAFERNE